MFADLTKISAGAGPDRVRHFCEQEVMIGVQLLVDDNQPFSSGNINAAARAVGKLVPALASVYLVTFRVAPSITAIWFCQV